MWVFLNRLDLAMKTRRKPNRIALFKQNQKTFLKPRWVIFTKLISENMICEKKWLPYIFSYFKKKKRRLLASNLLRFGACYVLIRTAIPKNERIKYRFAHTIPPLHNLIGFWWILGIRYYVLYRFRKGPWLSSPLFNEFISLHLNVVKRRNSREKREKLSNPILDINELERKALI